MHKDAARRRFDVVMAWSVDRLGRSLQDLCGFLSELHSLGIDLFLHQQGIDATTPAGKAMFQMMGVFAEFERSMIRERVNRAPAMSVEDIYATVVMISAISCVGCSWASRSSQTCQAVWRGQWHGPAHCEG
jgi:hypothetical protein